MTIITKGMGAVIKKMKPNVPKTKYDKSLRDLKLSVQKLKGSKAKTDQTIFEFKKGDKFTFPSSKKKTMKESDRKKQIMKDNTKVIGNIFKKALKGKK